VLETAQPCGSRIRHEDEKKRLRHFDENSADEQVEGSASATQDANLHRPTVSFGYGQVTSNSKGSVLVLLLPLTAALPVIL
jgi:hypothetical protein